MRKATRVPHADLNVRLQPRARRNEIGEPRDGRLAVKVTAPPVDGKANEALIALIAKHLNVPKRDITLTRGHQSRDKTLRIEGLSERQLAERTTPTPR